MKKRGMSLINPALVNASQVGELLSPIIAEVLKLNPKQIQYWVGKKGELQSEFRKILIVSNSIEPYFFVQWLDLYREEFGIELDVNNLQVPKYQENTWIVPVHESLTERKIFDVCKKHFPCDGIDFSLVRDLHRKGTTVRRFKASVEADEEHRNKSAKDLKEVGLEEKAITLKERMLLELWYFKTTGKHLDISSRTLCSGSRGADGLVPSAYWGGDRRFYVCWFGPDDRDGSLRSRVAVS